MGYSFSVTKTVSKLVFGFLIFVINHIQVTKNSVNGCGLFFFVY